MAMIRTVLRALLGVCGILLMGCGRQMSPSADQGDTLPFRYAENIIVVKHAQYTLVHLKDPWKKGRTLHTYVLAPKGVRLPADVAGSVVNVPLERSVVFNTAPASMLGM